MNSTGLPEETPGLWRRLVTACIRHSRATSGLVLLLSLGAAFFVSRLAINPDVNSLIQSDDPTMKLTRHLLGDTPLSRTLIVVLRAERPEDLESVMPDLVDRLRSCPSLKRVVATREDFLGARLAWIQRAPLYFLPPRTQEALAERLIGPGRRAELEAGKRRMAEDPLAGKKTFLMDPLGLRWIFDQAAEDAGNRFPAKLRSGTPYLVFDTHPPVAFIRATGTGDSFNLQFTRALMDDLEPRLKQVLGAGPVRAELSGGYVSATFQAATMKRDIELQFLTSIVGVFLVLVWLMRSWTLPAFVFLPVGLAILWGLGYGTALLGPLTPIAMSMTAIVAGLGTDYPIYLLTRFWIERPSRSRDDAIVGTQMFLGRPVLGASITTMAGFLVLGLSHFPGLRQFGIVTFLGFALAVLLAWILFPALGRVLDRLKPVRPAGAPAVVWAARSLVGRRFHRPAALGVLLLGAASWVGVALGGIPVDLDFRNMLSADDPGQKVLERLEGTLGISMSPVFALYDRSVPLETLKEGNERLQEKGVIAYSDGPQELVPGPEAARRAEQFRSRIDGWKSKTLDDLRSLGFRSERFEPALEELDRLWKAPAPSIEDLDRPEFSELRRTLTYEDAGRRYWVDYLWPRHSLWLPGERGAWNAAVQGPSGAPELYSVFHAPDHQAQAVRRDLSTVGGVAIAAIVVLTLLCLGRIGDGLLALVPVVTAIGLTLAVFSLFGGTIRSMNLAAIPILLGVGIDGGIYFVACLRARDWKDPAGAIDDMGTGYWGATVTTILGFGSIATSSTPGLRFLGVLVIVGMTSCFLATLFMLPALVRPFASPANRSPQGC